MSFIERLANRFGYIKRPPLRGAGASVRGFKAGESTRLTASFKTTGASINTDLYRHLRPMRTRSRDLWQNNEYMKRFIGLARDNIVGPAGTRLQNRARRRNGELDKPDNDLIEAHWLNFGLPANCTVTGRLSWPEVERLFIETAARDGEVLIRKRLGYAGSAHNYALQFLDIDRLDVELNEQARPGRNKIVMGVELDQDDRPVAYHILADGHPEGSLIFDTRMRRHVRIPAESMIHAFITHRPEQVRGVPWAHAAIIGLNDLGGYREAAIIAARVGANKLGFFTAPDGDPDVGDGIDETGNTIMNSEPGEFNAIPAETEIQSWDPAYPNGEFEPFNKNLLRGISGGLNVAYHNLASDLEGVNMSSARVGELAERDGWKALQSWMMGALHAAVFPEWLRHQLAIGALPLPPGQFAKFNAPRWQPRRWTWIDPLKDEQANAVAYGMRTKSLGQIIRERGEDPDETFDEIADEHTRLNALGIAPTIPSFVKIEETSTNA